ncbi:efflux RND transporter periplasmic adaptor subunit [Pleomorphomonas sp. PLEO]|uniref:efflux RND transporter periplasmic adaptor subunit n=1 Tax=Pleomorphomonas sp. PLEO TaxID=3239306 RepID=UPI00351F0D81
MNTITEHDRKLAETLRSLSPNASATTPPPTTGRRIALAFGALLVGATALAVLLWSPASEKIKALFPDAARLEVPSETGATSGASSGQATTRTAEAPATRAQPVPIREVTGSGYLIAPRSTAVFSKYQGQITSIAVDLGDPVVAGQVLVTLDDASARFSLEQAKIEEASAELVLAAKRITGDQAQSSLKRKETLAGVLSKQDVEDARTTWASAQNDVAQARQDLDKASLAVREAEEQVGALTIRAPIAGVVTRLGAHVGDTVLERADSVRESQSLLTIVDTSSMEIEADVAETNMSALRPGLSGEAVLDGFPDRPFPVEILRLAPAVSPDKGTIGLRLLPKAPPEGIRPGMAARIRLTTADTPQGAIDQ